MKLLLPLAIITLSLAAQISAYGVRGAAERVAWFAAYLAEDEYISLHGGEHTIAPGCVGSAPRGRCNMLEFLKHFWKNEADPRAGQQILKQPNKYLNAITNIEQFNKATITDMVNSIVSYSQKWSVVNEKGEVIVSKVHKLTGNIVAEKAVKGLHTYWDVVEQATKPIGIYRNMQEAGQVRSLNSKGQDVTKAFIAQAQRSVYRPHELRLEEYEGNDDRPGRVAAIKQNLMSILKTGDNLVVTKPYQTLSGHTRQFQVLDADATIQQIEARHEGQGESSLKQAHATWLAGRKGLNADHDRAIKGSQSALRTCNCDVPPYPAFA